MSLGQKAGVKRIGPMDFPSTLQGLEMGSPSLLLWATP